MPKGKKPKYEPGVIYNIVVTFERDGSEVEALLLKFKTHKYYWVVRKYEVQESDGQREEGDV